MMSSIRRAAQGLLAIVTFGAICLMGAGLVDAIEERDAILQAIELNVATRHLGVLELALSREHAATDLRLRGLAPEPHLARARAATDASLETLRTEEPGAARWLAPHLLRLRGAADRFHADGHERLPESWQDGMTDALLRVLSLRGEQSLKATRLPLHNSEGLLAQEELIQGLAHATAGVLEAERSLTRDPPDTVAAHRAALRTTGDLGATLRSAEWHVRDKGDPQGASSPTAHPGAPEVAAAFGAIAALPEPDDLSPQALTDWTANARRTIADMENAFLVLSDHSAEELGQRARETTITLALWLSAAVLVFTLLFQMRKIALREMIEPIERFRVDLTRLIEGLPETGPPEPSRLSEIRELQDALRGLKSSFRRRGILQRERLVLRAQLHESHRRTTEDLAAAAVVQRGMLPKHHRVGALRLA